MRKVLLLIIIAVVALALPACKDACEKAAEVLATAQATVDRLEVAITAAEDAVNQVCDVVFDEDECDQARDFLAMLRGHLDRAEVTLAAAQLAYDVACREGSYDTTLASGPPAPEVAALAKDQRELRRRANQEFKTLDRLLASQ